MKFGDLHPQAATIQVAYPGRIMGPFDWIEGQPGVYQTWMGGTCVCGSRTTWRYKEPGLLAAICSEECLAKFNGVVESENELHLGMPTPASSGSQDLSPLPGVREDDQNPSEGSGAL